MPAPLSGGCAHETLESKLFYLPELCSRLRKHRLWQKFVRSKIYVPITIGNHTYQYSDVQWKDSPVYFIPHRWDTVITHLEQCSSRMVLYMNVSARGGWLEPEVLWIRRDQAAAPVNLVKVQCNTSYILLILLDKSSSYFDLSIILHLKFCCIFIAHYILMAK